MSKYKVGQQVRIIKRGQAPPLPWSDTASLIGQLGIVKEYQDENGYWVHEIGDSKGYDWFDEDALEAV